MSLALLLASTDVRSITLLGGACALGFLAVQPSPMVVRMTFVALATYGITSLLLERHNAAGMGQRADAHTTSDLFSQSSEGTGARARAGAGARGGEPTVPHATLVHPEATRALAALAPLSRPGRRAAVRAVVAGTEGVVQAYHAILLLPLSSGDGGRHVQRASACIDDLRDRTTLVLDALQALRMGTGSRGPASLLAASAERDLRALFTRFRQIAGNKLKRPEFMGGPLPRDPTDDHRFVR